MITGDRPSSPADIEPCPICGARIGGEHGTPSMAHDCQHPGCVFGPGHVVDYHLVDGQRVFATPADIDTRIQAAEDAPHAPEALVERMARAICLAAYHGEPEWIWDRMGSPLRDDYLRLAAAALRVVTEPADGGAK